MLPKVHREELKEYFWRSDLVVDRLKLGSLGVVALEAIACGRPVIGFISSEFPEYKDFPSKNIKTEEGIAEVF